MSEPEYFPNRMRSPGLRSTATRWPDSSSLPLPTAITSACWGFSFAVSGIMIPPRICSASSRRFTRTRSCKGRKSMSSIISSDQLFHQRNQILLIERAGAIGARVEEPPHPTLFLQGEKEELFFDPLLVQKFLVKCPHRALERIRNPEILGRVEFGC